ncbi:uncharacterized protein LOC118752901 [Rhagoletis pomonella]|uniref:uncharacterized protein LOC118752901 n=1 Tax=Rhagoletis pomonella TaxID=28610 RepID=UPI00177D7DBB|nr:uncharacterized protein LOC118752901 [Rhagoletis pomonella]
MAEKDTDLSAIELVEEQKALMQSIQTTLRNFKKDSSSRKTASYHHAHLEFLASYRTEFRANHRILVRQSNNAEIRKSYVDAGICEQFEETYLDVVVCIRDSLREKCIPAASEVGRAPTLNNSTTILASNGVPLPEVKLTPFSGKYIDWPGFKEIFLDRVHQNTSLNNLQRFHYLKSALTDIAAQDIEHVSLIGENYEEAWEMLCKQYDNKRILFIHYMDVLDQQSDEIRENAASLKHFTQTCRSCVNSIAKLGINVMEQNQILVYYMVKKLPNSLRTEWDRSLRKQTSIPTFSELCSLLDEQYLMMVTSSRTGAKQAQSITSSQRKVEGLAPYGKKQVKSMHVAKKTVVCPICEKSDHPVRECAKFLEMNVVDKRAAVERYKLCFNCLGYNHPSAKCSSRRNCGTCGGQHHTLIHVEREVSASAPTATVPTAVAALHVAATPEMSDIPSQPIPRMRFDVLLPTAVICIKSATGQPCDFRALMDQGSQATFLSERAVQVLGLPCEKAHIEVIGLSGSKVTKGRFCVHITIGSRIDSQIQYQTVAYVLPKVGGVLPSRNLVTNFDHLDGIRLADPRYFEPQPVDVLLGNDIYDECILSDVRRAGSGFPIAQETTFGYIISGKNATGSQSPKSVSFSSTNTEMEVDSLLRKFWELEEMGESRALTTEDNWCEVLYQSTHKRLQSGKYVVRLPLMSEIDTSCFIGKSRSSALKRFLHLEGRLSKDADLSKIYIDTINEYLRLKQMKPVRYTEDQHCSTGGAGEDRFTCCYLPHHPVVKMDAASTKVRIVFDASMKTTNGKSLNDILATGPALQQDLSAILSNWRTMKYVFIADIEKMFRCIDVNEEDAQYQRILWRERPGEPIQEYYCSTVMFGTASAPYTAIRTINQLAEDEAERFPLAAKVLKQQMYVDDILSGGDSLELALRVRDETISILRTATFELRKWALQLC